MKRKSVFILENNEIILTEELREKMKALKEYEEHLKSYIKWLEPKLGYLPTKYSSTCKLLENIKYNLSEEYNNSYCFFTTTLLRLRRQLCEITKEEALKIQRKLLSKED